MKKKVCFVSIGVYPLFNPRCVATFGGAEVQLYLLGKEFHKRGRFEVSYLAGDFGQNKIESFNGIRVYRGIYPHKEDSFFRKIYKGFLLLWFLYRVHADIYIMRSASMGPGVAAFFCRLFRKKFVFMTAHEVDCNGVYEKMNSKIVGLIYRLGIKYASKIVTQNKDHKKLLSDHYKLPSVVILSGYDIEQKKPKKNNTILWVGRCEDWKQPEMFIRLALLFHNYTFVMICPVSHQCGEKYFDKIYTEAQQVRNVQFIKKVPFSEIDAYFERATVFVNTSRYEGFPNTFIQAMKNYTPLLSLSVNPDNFIEEQECGFFAHGDFKILQEKLVLLMHNKQLREKISNKAFLYARQHHNIKNIATTYEQLFSNL